GAAAGGDAAPFRGELHRVGEQVEHHLLEQAVVGNEPHALADAGGEREPLVLGAARHHPHGVVEERLELDLLGGGAGGGGPALPTFEGVLVHCERVMGGL